MFIDIQLESSKISHHINIFKFILNICYSTITIPLNTNYYDIISHTIKVITLNVYYFISNIIAIINQNYYIKHII